MLVDSFFCHTCHVRLQKKIHKINGEKIIALQVLRRQRDQQLALRQQRDQQPAGRQAMWPAVWQPVLREEWLDGIWFLELPMALKSWG